MLLDKTETRCPFVKIYTPIFRHTQGEGQRAPENAYNGMCFRLWAGYRPKTLDPKV